MANGITITDGADIPVALLDRARTVGMRFALLAQEVTENGIPVFLQTTNSLAKILRSNGIEVELVPTTTDARYRDNRGLEWVGPVVFVGAALYSHNPGAVTVAMNLISAYLYDLFRGQKHDLTVQLSVVCERRSDRSLRRMNYRGPIEGLERLPAVVRDMFEGNDADREK